MRGETIKVCGHVGNLDLHQVLDILRNIMGAQLNRMLSRESYLNMNAQFTLVQS